jgi:hypothetical protein
MRQAGSSARGLGNRGSAALWAFAGLAAAGLACLVYQARRGQADGGSGTSPCGDLQANARKALAMREAKASWPPYPQPATLHEGMRPIPNPEAAPSGALNQEGHRPVLERSRKVR